MRQVEVARALVACPGGVPGLLARRDRTGAQFVLSHAPAASGSSSNRKRCACGKTLTEGKAHAGSMGDAGDLLKAGFKLWPFQYHPRWPGRRDLAVDVAQRSARSFDFDERVEYLMGCNMELKKPLFHC